MKTADRNDNINITKVLWQSALIVLMAAAISLGVNYLRRDGLALVGRRAPEASSSAMQTAQEAVISIDEARALFLTNGAVFIDARPSEAFRSGHIQGALNLPPDSFEQLLPGIREQIPPDSLIITYCDGESCNLSKEAALQLSGNGYSHVQVLADGWSAWLDAGLPTEKTP
jgi:rhodanese-related sulfurtransferase